MNLNHTLELNFVERRGHPAIRHANGEVSYGVLHEAICRLAHGLQKSGIVKGDRVALMLPNIPQFVIAYFAILRLGAVVVPVNMMLKGREVASLLEDCEARAAIAWGGLWDDLEPFVDHIRSLKCIILLGEGLPSNVLNLTRLIARSTPLTEIIEIDDDDPAIVQYSSGSTGRPKGAELTHGNILSNLKACREILAVTQEDIFLASVPLYHPMGQTLLMHLALSTGATMSLFTKFEPEEIVEVIYSGKHSLFVGHPSMFKMLLDATMDNERAVEDPLRLCICGGGTIEDDTLKAFEKRFGTYILEAYTMTETSPVASFNQWRTGRRVGSLGHPLPDVEMKVVDDRNNEVSIGEVGEIVVKGANVMRGYVNRPQLTAVVLKDGWFHTGDRGRMDINGFFYLSGRMHERIIKGGFSIYPSEVEDVLRGHPDVEDVAVIGIPDPVMGQEVKACVVLRNGASVTTEYLANYCRQHMALYKVPAVIRFYKDLPRNSERKFDKNELGAG
jgi:long-chain acyl-CoA synthetase